MQPPMLGGTDLVLPQDMEPSLADELRHRVAQVDARVSEAKGLYAQEAVEVRHAALAVARLRQQLRLGSYERSLTPATGKPQLLLQFWAPQEDRSVLLKVYGRERRGEARVQRQWLAAGIRTPRIIAYEETPISWLLMDVVPGSPAQLGHVGSDDQRMLHCNLASVMSKAHSIRVELPPSRSLERGVGRHLDLVLGVLERHGYPIPSRLPRLARALYRQGSATTLHGDLTPTNIMCAPGNVLTLIDCAAYYGDASFDAARWCARTASNEVLAPNARGALQEAQGLWLECGRVSSKSLFHHLTGLELYMEAGVRELRKEEQGQPWDVIDEMTTVLLELAERHLAELS